MQVNLNREGRLTVGVVTDMGEACAKSRADYDGHGVLVLDFGLSTLFATSEGQLLGQGWLRRLRCHDALLTMIAAGQLRAGKKPRESRRYRALVENVRGFLRTEVGRVLDRLVAEGRPKELVLERLDFRNPDLSRRLSAILRNCGRSVIQAKLADLQQRIGITSTEVDTACSSQTCSNPVGGYVDKRNRPAQGTARCLWCHHAKHADLNAAPNIRERQVRNPCPRRTGSRRAPADPRRTNPYFGGVPLAVVRSPERHEASVKS